MIRQQLKNGLHSTKAKNQLTLATRWFCKFYHDVIGADMSVCTQVFVLEPTDDVSLPQEVI